MFNLRLPAYPRPSHLALQKMIDLAELEVLEAAYNLYDSPYGPTNIHFAELRDELIVANCDLNSLLNLNDRILERASEWRKLFLSTPASTELS